MTEMLLLAIVVILSVIAGFLIPTLIELKNASKELSKFLNATESTLKPTLEELNAVLKEVKGITSDINAVTTDVRKFSSAVGGVAENIHKINSIMDEIPTRVSGIRAAVGAAFGFLLANLFKKGQ